MLVLPLNGIGDELAMALVLLEWLMAAGGDDHGSEQPALHNADNNKSSADAAGACWQALLRLVDWQCPWLHHAASATAVQSVETQTSEEDAEGDACPEHVEDAPAESNGSGQEQLPPFLLKGLQPILERMKLEAQYEPALRTKEGIYINFDVRTRTLPFTGDQVRTIYRMHRDQFGATPLDLHSLADIANIGWAGTEDAAIEMPYAIAVQCGRCRKDMANDSYLSLWWLWLMQEPPQG